MFGQLTDYCWKMFRLFKSLDVNNDNYVSLSELKKLMMNVDFGETSWNVDEATSHIMEDLDTNHDQQIDEEEFVDGFKELLNTNNDLLTPKTPGPKDVSRVSNLIMMLLMFYEVHVNFKVK